MYKLVIFLFFGLQVQTPISAHASAKPYRHLGCYKDLDARAIDSLEGTNTTLDGHYRNRVNQIEKCYKVSLSKSYKVFAIQDGGQCFGSATAETTYKQYGKTTGCTDGKGGPMSNDVYEIAKGAETEAQKKVSPYELLGCYKDDIPRALTSIDTAVSKKHGHYKSRSHPLQNCLETAKAGRYKFFALQDGGQCFGSNSTTAYKKYGTSNACLDGKGAPMANSVYVITIDDVETEEGTSAAPEHTTLEVATTEDQQNGTCCNKVRVESNGAAKNTHFWSLGTFIRRSGSLRLIGVTYEQLRAQDNSDQYYLAKTENGGWKIGRLWDGQVESLIYYDASDAKIKCPNDIPKKPWMVKSGHNSVPDNTLKIQCEV
jgi:hypothetical protein